jgi:hypothetical protein
MSYFEKIKIEPLLEILLFFNVILLSIYLFDLILFIRKWLHEADIKSLATYLNGPVLLIFSFAELYIFLVYNREIDLRINYKIGISTNLSIIIAIMNVFSGINYQFMVDHKNLTEKQDLIRFKQLFYLQLQKAQYY